MKLKYINIRVILRGYHSFLGRYGFGYTQKERRYVYKIMERKFIHVASS